jgi:hypothetical protein
VVSLHFLQYSKIKKTETKEKQTRLSHKEDVLDFCLEEQPVKKIRKKEDEKTKKNTVQPHK